MAVKVKGFSGVACTVLGPVKVWEPWTYLATDPETGEEFEEESGEGEWVEGDGSRVRVRMVGDDHVYEVEASDCEEIEPEDYCDGCGQIGCAHGSQREA
jgi:hypothetical protein